MLSSCNSLYLTTSDMLYGTRSSPSKSVFIAWRRLSRRTILLSRYLGIDTIFIYDSPPYLRAFLSTLNIVRRGRYNSILAQLPQGPLLASLALLKKLYKFKLFVDVHTGFLVYDNFKGYILNRPFYTMLSYCNNIILHNHTIYEEVVPPRLRERCIVVYDPWFLLEDFKKYCPSVCEEHEYVVFPASFAPDEPIDEVLSVLSRMKKIKVYVTGNANKHRDIVMKYKSSNIIFTGYIPDEEYYRLLCCAKAIVAGTKREYTALMSAWEALAFNKPLALSYTKTLYRIFAGYAYFYNLRNSKSVEDAIINAISSSQPAKEIYTKLKNETIQQLNQLKKYLHTT
ncbi:MAG: glycosyltransferase [Ignisphaera sp.]